MYSGYTPGTINDGPLSILMMDAGAGPKSTPPTIGPPHRSGYSGTGIAPRDKSAASVARGPTMPQGWFMPRNFLGGL